MCPGDEGNRSGRGHKLRFLEERGPGDARVLPGVGSTPRPTPHGNWEAAGSDGS